MCLKGMCLLSHESERKAPRCLVAALFFLWNLAMASQFRENFYYGFIPRKRDTEDPLQSRPIYTGP